MLHHAFQVTAPANTPKAAPAEIATNFRPGRVERIRLHIPAGHASLTGIQIAIAHQQVVPYNVGGWVLGNDDEHTFEPGLDITSGQWSVLVYNTDQRAHYWQVIYDVRELAPPAPALVASHVMIPAQVIYAEALV